MGSVESALLLTTLRCIRRLPYPGARKPVVHNKCTPSLIVRIAKSLLLLSTFSLTGTVSQRFGNCQFAILRFKDTRLVMVTDLRSPQTISARAKLLRLTAQETRSIFAMQTQRKPSGGTINSDLKGLPIFEARERKPAETKIRSTTGPIPHCKQQETPFGAKSAKKLGKGSHEKSTPKAL